MTRTQVPGVEQAPEWLNYHHLFYFWRITREGGLARAAARLHVSHSTVSAQLRSLESFLGAPLFERRGRRLVLTPLGAETAAYAEDIFRLGSELVDVARGRAQSEIPTFRVGVVSSLPKTLVYRLLEPVLREKKKLRMHMRQAELTRLLPELAAHRLHLVLSDRPAAEGSSLPVHSHLLGESEIWLYGDKKLAARYRPLFPTSLQNAPVLYPGHDSALRSVMERWFADRGLRVQMAADADDAGMLRAFGARGFGLFPVRAGLRSEVEASSEAEWVGCLEGAKESYYAISVERRVRHPAAARMMEAARDELTERNKKGKRTR
ncbi:MAG TPA: LysR family transcriptional regulator [Polyangiales bacterium]|nr:LysR family transcriptional regulator [Polyangiales bacterium]